MLWFKSDNRGILIAPSPPSFLGVLIQAKCVKCESTEQATTSVLIFLNSEIRSLNAKISVGHTKVLKWQQFNIRFSPSPKPNQIRTNQVGRKRKLGTSL